MSVTHPTNQEQLFQALCMRGWRPNEYFKLINIEAFTGFSYNLTHENPMQPMASPNMSPRIDGNEFPDGK